MKKMGTIIVQVKYDWIRHNKNRMQALGIQEITNYVNKFDINNKYSKARYNSKHKFKINIPLIK